MTGKALARSDGWEVAWSSSSVKHASASTVTGLGVCGPSPALVSVGDLQNALGGLHIEVELGGPQSIAGDVAG